MKKLVLVLVVMAALFNTAGAQENSSDSYFGIGAAVFSGAVIPTFSLQIGGPISDSIELRANVDTLLVFSVIGADLLFVTRPQNDFKLYFGFGPDLLLVPTLGSAFEFHGTAGLEFRLADGEGVGLYAEVKPLLISTFNLGLPVGQIRGGINIHF